MVNVLIEANRIVQDKWRTTGTGWRVLLAIGIIIAAAVGLVALVVWLFIKFLKALSTGGMRNADLYFPARRRR